MIQDKFFQLPQQLDKRAIDAYTNCMMDVNGIKYLYLNGHITKESAENQIKNNKNKMGKLFGEANEATKCEMIMVETKFKKR